MNLYEKTIPKELMQKAKRLYGEQNVYVPSSGLLCIKTNEWVLPELKIKYDHEYTTVAKSQYPGGYSEPIAQYYNRVIDGICHNVAYRIIGSGVFAILIDPRIDQLHHCPANART